MQYNQSLYEFNDFVNHYQEKDLDSFNQKIVEVFNVTSKMAIEQLKIIQDLTAESVSTREYVSQILLENVSQIKSEPAKIKVKNLINELGFAQLAYKNSFEKDAEEINDIESLLLEWTRLLKLNKKLSIFMFSQPSFIASQPIIEKLIIAKDIMSNNIEILIQPLKCLCDRQTESLALYNTICEMSKNASKIHKNY